MGRGVMPHLKECIFRALCYFCRTLEFSQAEAIKKLHKAFPTSSLSESTVSRYYRTVLTVNDIVPKEVKRERPPNERLLSLVETHLIGQNQISARQLASQVPCSVSTVLRYAHTFSSLKYVPCRIIPHPLTDELRK